MASVARKSGRWYAILSWVEEMEQGSRRRREWVKLPVDVKFKKDATAAAKVIEANRQRERLRLPLIESGDKLPRGWVEVAAEMIVDVEGRSGRNWRANCNAFVRTFAEFVGDAEPTSRLGVEYVRARRSAKASDSTLRKEVLFLKRIFRQALKERVVGENPFEDVRLAKDPKHPPRYLTREEFGWLLDVAPASRRFRYRFLVTTGVRKVEALRLRWRDVDFENGMLHVRTASKGRGPRYPMRAIPLPEDFLAELKGRRDEAKARPDHTIFGETTGEHWTRDLSQDLKLAGIAIHGARNPLRHTFCSWLAQSGEVTLQEIRDLAGHESITTTEIYAHLLPVPRAVAAKTFAHLGRNEVEQDRVIEVAE